MVDTGLPIATRDTLTAALDWLLVLPIVLCLMGAAVALILRRAGAWSFAFTAIVLCAVVACNGALLLRIVQEGPLAMTMGNWLPPFGISLVADLFSAGFALAGSVVTLLVLVYAQGERGRDANDGFHALLLLLLGGVSGAFLTGDLFNLYVWFEVMLIASFGLLVLAGRPLQLDAAVKYGFLNFLATAFFLLALGMLYGLLGTLNMADIIRVAPAANPAAMAAVAALLLLAFGIKAAAFPANAWLPASYHAPPAAISALFAGLLTKVGAYAVLRVLVALLPESRAMLEPVLVMVAVGTLVIAPLGALAETKLRRAIGFLMIGGIGSIFAGVAVPTPAGAGGAGLYVFHAILTMTALYLTAGLVERATGARDTRAMGGLYASHPGLSVLFFVLVLAVAGVPPFLGFWPKLLLLQAALDQGEWGGLLAAGLLVNAVLTLIAGTRLWSHVFWRPALDGRSMDLTTGRAALWTGYGAATVLIGMIFAAGIWPNGLFAVLDQAVPDLLDSARYVAAVGLAEGTP